MNKEIKTKEVYEIPIRAFCSVTGELVATSKTKESMVDWSGLRMGIITCSCEGAIVNRFYKYFFEYDSPSKRGRYERHYAFRRDDAVFDKVVVADEDIPFADQIFDPNASIKLGSYMSLHSANEDDGDMEELY